MMCIQDMIGSHRHVIIMLKAPGKDQINPKYMVKLVIIVNYECKMVSE